MTTPEETGRLAAEALIANLEKLKRDVGGGPDAPLERQEAAAALAVEALKQVLPGAFDRLRPPQ